MLRSNCHGDATPFRIDLQTCDLQIEDFQTRERESFSMGTRDVFCEDASFNYVEIRAVFQVDASRFFVVTRTFFRAKLCPVKIVFQNFYDFQKLINCIIA